MNGDFLRKKIDDAGFQLVDVANYLNISPQALQSKLRSKDIGVSFLIDIANAINKNVYYFFEANEITKCDKNEVNIIDHKNDHNKDHKPNVKISPPLIEDPINGIPLIPIDAIAGFGVGDMSVMEYEVSRYVVPEFEELHVEFMIRVKGSSMYPKYNSGDLVACKRLVLNDIFFQWNKVYVLDTEQGALIKRVKKGKDQSHILLVSDNAAYDPFELSIEKVRAIAIVLGVIRLE